MAYGGNEIAWENLAQSLKDRLESTGGGFGAKSKVVASWNDALDNGFYVSSGDAPTNEWYIGEVISDDVGSRVVQRIMPYGKTIDYIRTKTDNVWSAWVKNDYVNTIKATTETIMWYVSPTGNDITGDGTQAKPFKSIQTTIDKVPKTINHTVTINVMEGVYDEEIFIRGFSGTSRIFLTGSNSADTTRKAKGLTIAQNNVEVYIKGLHLGGNAFPVYVYACNYVNISFVNITDSHSSSGMLLYSSSIIVQQCNISNRGTALQAGNLATVTSNSNTGSNNTTGLTCNMATIIKLNSQPSHTTTAEAVGSGGIIR